VKKTVLDLYEVSILNNTYEGILWLKLSHRHIPECVSTICVCYLPPENSSRHVDAADFFDTLLSHVYSYQNSNIRYICGDFNSRCAKLLDYVEGVDCLPDRNTVDNTVNNHGRLFCEFLINANICIVNGRKGADDFTYVSTRGASVVDYCICNYECLDSILCFKVMRPNSLVEEAGLAGVLDAVAVGKLDHSMLVWSINLDSYYRATPTHDTDTVIDCVLKCDTGWVPDSFLASEGNRILLNDIITELETSDHQQCDIDSAFSSFRDTVLCEMYSTLPTRRVVLTSNQNAKKRLELQAVVTVAKTISWWQV